MKNSVGNVTLKKKQKQKSQRLHRALTLNETITNGDRQGVECGV